MKWLKKYLRTTFNFTIDESQAIIVLFSIIILCFLSILVINNFNKEKELAIIFNEISTDEFKKEAEVQKTNSGSISKKYVNFDPNTASKSVLLANNISLFAVNNILKYRSKNGHYNTPEDLKKTYGISEEDYKNLLPYIQIEGRPKFESNYKKQENFEPYTYNKENFKRNDNQKVFEKKPSEIVNFDINTADTTQLKQIPGIGSAYSKRILKFRDLLGGFYSTSQIKNTLGLSPELADEVIKHCKIEKSPIKIDINSNDFKHFYIKPNQKKAIQNYRKEHGDFKQKTDLKAVFAISETDYKLISPYLDLP